MKRMFKWPGLYVVSLLIMALIAILDIIMLVLIETGMVDTDRLLK